MTEELTKMSESYVKIEGSLVGGGTVVQHGNGRQRCSWILTCEHVVRGETVVSVVYREGARFRRVNARIVAVDVDHDLALLRTTKKVSTKVPVVVAAEEPDLYTRGYVMGTAAQLYGTAGEVLLTARGGSNGYTDGYQFTGVIASGMSGGMLCNQDGELVGVPHAQEREDDRPLGNIGFAVPLPVVKAFLEAHGVVS